jgi:hypothetical protein
MLAIGPKLGTLGVGVESKGQIAPHFFARAGVNYLVYERSFSGDKIRYKGKVRLLNVPVMLDYHPVIDSGFRVSTGIVFNKNYIEASASPNITAPGGISIEGSKFMGKEIGVAKAKYQSRGSLSGIFTVGYDGAFLRYSQMSFNFEAGVMISGPSKLAFEMNGTAASDDAKRAAIKADIESGFKNVKSLLEITPVVNLGIKFEF